MTEKPRAERIAFVQQCGELLCIAKPNLVSCELKLGRDITRTSVGEQLQPNEEYVVVSCDNGYTYNILVEANSLSAIALAIFKEMAYK